MPPKVLYKINNRIERDSQTSVAIHQFSLLRPFLFILLSFHFVSLLEFLIKNNKKNTKGERGMAFTKNHCQNCSEYTRDKCNAEQ